MDFGGFGEASWEGKSSQDGTKIDSKMHQKNDEKNICLGGPWVEEAKDGAWMRADPRTPYLTIMKENYTPQTRYQKTTRTRRRAKARWWIFILMYEVDGLARQNNDKF